MALLNLNVYVVEDDAVVLLNLCEYFEEKGHHIVGNAQNGEEAVKEVISLQPDLVVMDVMLKGKMSGIEAAKIIRENYFCTILFLTANADLPDVEAMLALPCVDYNVKPYNEKMLDVSLVKLEKDCTQLRSIKLSDTNQFDMKTLQLYRNGTLVSLSKRETELLMLLIRHRGEFLKYEFIDFELWPDKPDITASARKNLFQKLILRLEKPFWEVKEGMGVLIEKY